MDNIENIEGFLHSKCEEIDFTPPTPKQVEAWLEEYARPFKIKADMWDKLDEEIGEFFDPENDEIYFEEIGETVARVFNYI